MPVTDLAGRTDTADSKRRTPVVHVCKRSAIRFSVIERNVHEEADMHSQVGFDGERFSPTANAKACWVACAAAPANSSRQQTVFPRSIISRPGDRS
jgi:hypothetical protein